jgi:hypothetical protein
MTRWKLAVTAAGTLLLIGGALYETGWFSGDNATRGQPCQIRAADPMDTPAGWRYRENRPHHWRYIMLQK